MGIHPLSDAKIALRGADSTATPLSAVAPAESRRQKIVRVGVSKDTSAKCAAIDAPPPWVAARPSTRAPFWFGSPRSKACAKRQVPIYRGNNKKEDEPNRTSAVAQCPLQRGQHQARNNQKHRHEDRRQHLETIGDHTINDPRGSARRRLRQGGKAPDRAAAGQPNRRTAPCPVGRFPHRRTKALCRRRRLWALRGAAPLVRSVDRQSVSSWDIVVGSLGLSQPFPPASPRAPRSRHCCCGNRGRT